MCRGFGLREAEETEAEPFWRRSTKGGSGGGSPLGQSHFRHLHLDPPLPPLPKAAEARNSPAHKGGASVI